MELRVLRYYLTVVREENITRAAEILHLTQPTLSRQLSEPEAVFLAGLSLSGSTVESAGDEITSWLDGLALD